jgi:hypothetical protein
VRRGKTRALTTGPDGRLPCVCTVDEERSVKPSNDWYVKRAGGDFMVIRKDTGLLADMIFSLSCEPTPHIPPRSPWRAVPSAHCPLTAW